MSGESARRRGEELVAAGDPQSATWLAGAEGERRVARELDRLPSSWTVIHDRLLMPGLAESNIDHIVDSAWLATAIAASGRRNWSPACGLCRWTGSRAGCSRSRSASPMPAFHCASFLAF